MVTICENDNCTFFFDGDMTFVTWRKQSVSRHNRVFVLWDEEGKFVVHSDWTSSFCYYTLFGNFRCTFNYHAGLGKHCWYQKFAITMSSVCFILWSSPLKYPLVSIRKYKTKGQEFGAILSELTVAKLYVILVKRKVFLYIFFK